MADRTSAYLFGEIFKSLVELRDGKKTPEQLAAELMKKAELWRLAERELIEAAGRVVRLYHHPMGPQHDENALAGLSLALSNLEDLEEP